MAERAAVRTAPTTRGRDASADVTASSSGGQHAGETTQDRRPAQPEGSHHQRAAGEDQLPREAAAGGQETAAQTRFTDFNSASGGGQRSCGHRSSRSSRLSRRR